MTVDVRPRLQGYLGIPFRDHGRDRNGCDCWGLVCLVYREQLGLALPDLGDLYADAYARAQVDATVGQATAEGWNTEVTGQARRPLDVLTFRRGGIETHVGLWVAPGLMLHVMEGMAAAFERYDTARWSRRLCRALRHREVC